jgi:hypothetical protein
MEPSGRNWWQPVANGRAPRTAQSSENRCRGLHQSPELFHGKEGVDGSSPSEGFAKDPHSGAFLVQIDLHSGQRAPGMEPFMELSVPERTVSATPTRTFDSAEPWVAGS